MNFLENEYIEVVKISCGILIDSIYILTNFGNLFNYGGKGGSYNEIDYREENNQILGFYGGYGGNLHNIGVHYADKRDINYCRRLFWIIFFFSHKKCKERKEIAKKFLLISNKKRYEILIGKMFFSDNIKIKKKIIQFL